MVQKLSVLGIDMAKLVFHVVGMDNTGTVVLWKRMAQSELLHCIATLPPLLIAMEPMFKGTWRIEAIFLMEQN